MYISVFSAQEIRAVDTQGHNTHIRLNCIGHQQLEPHRAFQPHEPPYLLIPPFPRTLNFKPSFLDASGQSDRLMTVKDSRPPEGWILDIDTGCTGRRAGGRAVA